LSKSRRIAALCIVFVTLGVDAAYAGHPMLSEDTGTQGKGNFELELGYDWSRQDGQGNFLFQPQLSIGVSPTLDLIVQPSWLIADDASGMRVRGFGDTNLDAKWRFYGAAPWTLGVRAGLEVPTAQDDLGLRPRSASPHGILVATADLAPFAINLNFGFAHVATDADQRSGLWHASAAATYAIGERLFLVLDAAEDSNPDRGGPRYQAVALVGAIYTIRPGLDIDAGLRSRLNAIGPTQQWLLGITYRGAL
jgi:hypothetical protein